MEWYAYVGNSPLNRVDPSGEGWLSWLGIGLAAGAAIFTRGASSLAVGLFGVSAHTAATAATVLSIGAGVAGAGNVGTGLHGSLGNRAPFLPSAMAAAVPPTAVPKSI